ARRRRGAGAALPEIAGAPGGPSGAGSRGGEHAARASLAGQRARAAERDRAGARVFARAGGADGAAPAAGWVNARRTDEGSIPSASTVFFMKYAGILVGTKRGP